MNTEQSEELLRQRNALVDLGDDIMSVLHSHQLREPQIRSEVVIAWIRGLYDTVQKGLGKPAHFFPEK
jgi:hypothetical protein